MSDEFPLKELEPLVGEFGQDLLDGFCGFLDRGVGTGGVVACCKLLWPGFVSYRGGIFVDFQFDQAAVDQWFDQCSDVTEVESMVNHLHLWDLFISSAEDVPEVHLEWIAKVISRTWMSAAADAFPQRCFEATVARAPEDYGPTVYFQTRPQPK